MLEMIRPLHFFSPMILCLAVLLFAGPSASVDLPRNIVENHIRSSANFSVDPCEDFYLHVCPDNHRQDFMKGLNNKKLEVVGEIKAQSKFLRQFTFNDKIRTLNFIDRLSVKQLEEICLKNGTSGNMNQADPECFNEGECGPLQDFSKSSCSRKAQLAFSLFYSDDQYEYPRTMLIYAVDAMIMTSLNKKLDTKARNLFKTLKSAAAKEFKKTPWALKNHAVNDYVAALDRMKLYTFSDYAYMVKDMLYKYRDDYQSCLQQVMGSFGEKIDNVVCEVFATKNGFALLKKPTSPLYDYDSQKVLRDTLNMFNYNDTNAYLGNDFMLLLNTNRTSDLYGSLGFSLLHEIMHTFVFDSYDFSVGKDLASSWTKSADCVAEQAMKTCKNFPVVVAEDNITPYCDTNMTFEEDAADIAAYRIAYDIYRKTFQRKTAVENYDALNPKQLFFYGAAVFFCVPKGRETQTYTPVSHSRGYQRVLSLMSQMDEFAEAFQCKRTDKMVTNKARHCVIYGSDAPSDDN